MAREKVVVVGGGGHAKVVIDILQENAEFHEILGFTSLDFKGESLLGVPYLGDDSMMTTLRDVDSFIVAIGDNSLRKKIYQSLSKVGLRPINVISKKAYVSPHASLGQGVVICPGSVINPSAVLHDNVIVNTLAGVDHDCVLNSHCHVGPGASLAGGVVVGEGAFVGMKSSILPERLIGEWSVLGAGAVVIKDINPYTTAVGVPAKKIK
ncbi:acetyltransferase [Paenibacillus algicola]|uniref:acetyltransferase n=1 Tax=Paenibacillus algicola TaxID=2565926 RepID=UPI0010FD90BB|nr:acetyltransferase [Paenibacillus algicola]